MNKINVFLRENGLFYDENKKELCKYWKTLDNSASGYSYEVINHCETIQDALKECLTRYEKFNLEKSKTIVEMWELVK